jgi:Dockerin type I domain
MTAKPRVRLFGRAFVVGMFATLCAAPLRSQQVGKGKEDVEAREEYFWAQRSYPNTERPYAKMQAARQLASNSLQARFTISGAGGVAGGWRSLGPNGIYDAGSGYFGSGPMLDAGRVTAVAPSPNSSNLYIGTASGGVWRSIAGAYWTPLTDTQCNLTTGALSLDAADPNVIYAGTGEYNIQSSGCGILRSTDGGASWTQLGASAFAGVTYTSSNGTPMGSGYAALGKIIVSRPAGGSVSNTVLIAASNVGIYRSTNGGSTWSYLLSGATASIVGHSTKAGVIFAGNSGKSAVYKSADNGATWTALPAMPSIDVTKIRRIELAVTPAAPDLVYALVGGTDRKFLGLFVWNDATASWTALAANGLYTGLARGDFGAQTEYDLAIAVDPRNASRVYVAGLRAFRSTDGGATFTNMGLEIHCDWHTIVIDPRNPDILYAGTDGGVFVSADVGNSWISRNGGLTITQYYPGISAAPDGSRILGGSQDNGTHLYTGSTYWNGFVGGDGGYTAINYAQPSIMYAESQWDPNSGGADLLRFNGTTFALRTSGISATDRASFIPPYVIDPVTPTTLYFGTQRLYKTTNEGTLWTPISLDLTKGVGSIMTIAVAKSDPLTIYTGSNDGQAVVTRDGGLSYTAISTGLPNRAITRIAVDPADATHALLTVSGFGSGHVFETTNAGSTWKDISTGLVDAPANAVAFVPGVGIMIGTDVGVFQASSPGAVWGAAPAGIPNVIVQDLIYVPAAKMVLAGTYGRGMYAYTVGGDAAVLRGDVNADGKVDAFDALLVQQALVGSVPAGIVIYPRGDADCNFTIQTADVIAILRSAVGLSTTGICVDTVK